VAAGSSFGVSRVDTPDELAAAVDAALRLGGRALVEDVVVGREIDIAVVERPDGRLFLGPPLEIDLGGRALFDVERKYDGSARFCVPAPMSHEAHTDLERAALAMFEAMGCSGLARVDFFLTSDGLVLNEVNTMPGLTEHSQVPKMFAAVGLPYPRLLDLLIATALGAVAARG
jgi:D-alanine-D-alanine ligase